MVLRDTISLVGAGVVVTVGILSFVVAPVVIKDTEVRIKSLFGSPGGPTDSTRSPRSTSTAPRSSTSTRPVSGSGSGG